jgi:ataxin-3
LNLYNVEIKPIKQSDAQNMLKENMDKLEAFIFNSIDHWFVIRKIDNIWFNLNSTNPLPGPQIISEFYLSAFLKGTEDLGYSNFIVNNLPPLKDFSDPIYNNLPNECRIVSIKTILDTKVNKINIGDGNQEEMDMVIEQSKRDYINNNFDLVNNEGNVLLFYLFIISSIN